MVTKLKGFCTRTGPEKSSRVVACLDEQGIAPDENGRPPPPRHRWLRCHVLSANARHKKGFLMATWYVVQKQLYCSRMSLWCNLNLLFQANYQIWMSAKPEYITAKKKKITL